MKNYVGTKPQKSIVDPMKIENIVHEIILLLLDLNPVLSPA